MINADVLAAAQARPTIVLDGETHKGEVLGWAKWRSWYRRLETFTDDPNGMAEEETQKMFTEFFTDLGFKPEVTKKLLALSEVVLAEILRDVFRCHLHLKAPVEATPAS